MPDKQLTIATYAAGASLAAITLVYVFGPTFFIDGEPASTSASSRKKTIVGLSNPANDCFINSVLQALAGLSDLRIYLIRETHRRKLDGRSVYSKAVTDPAHKTLPAWKLEGLQHGIVSQGLKDILDALNERPIYKKTISAAQFVQVLETAFKQRISRQQQDAQELLQIVAERLCDEYHAGHRARDHARKIQKELDKSEQLDKEVLEDELEHAVLENSHAPRPIVEMPSPEYPPQRRMDSPREDLQQDGGHGKSNLLEQEEGFPLEGGSESQIECLTCGFKPRATTTTFCSLTLSVPQVSSTTLSSCFDQMFKTEYIDDFKCEKCRLVHALELLQQELSTSNSERFKAQAIEAILKLETAIAENPEAELHDVELPDRKFAPKRKIAKHVRITKFPKVMAIHLSRSIFDAARTTMKNSAKVAFPERLPLGGLLDQKFYRLSSVVCHKGSHHSGHYETFRRQNVVAPFATLNTFQIAPVYSKPTTPIRSQISTPRSVSLAHPPETNGDTSTLSSTPELLSPTSAASSSPSLPYINGARRSGESSRNGRSFSTSTGSTDTTTAAKGATSSRRDTSDTNSIRSVARSARDSLTGKIPELMKRKGSKSTSTQSPSNNKDQISELATGTNLSGASDVIRGKRKVNKSNRWWRISDDKIKESKTSDVLGMQREVYLLFYELEKDD
jgi:ubiquitin carboxyl-terminal hydrolase 16